jgi:signal transduction histidine kinase
VKRALDILRENRSEVPFIIVSGTIGEERAVDSMKAGATDYVIKDRLERLGPVVERALHEARNRKERKNLEQQLLQAQKMESIGQLAGGVAHDFNNLLTVIQGHASLLLIRPDLDTQGQESVEQIALAAERAATLTRQLLTFSRKQVMQARCLDLNEVVGGVTKMLTRFLGEDVHLQVHYGSRSPYVQGDAGMIEQVLMNLAVNARDAMPRGGHLTIRTEDESVDADYVQLNPDSIPGNYVCLSVSDTGCGIPPEILPRIFEPFFTTKEVGKGTGLGLATVYGIVHQHRGWVSVYSEVGQGTVFRIYLPSSKGGENMRPANMEPEVRGGSETILLVEDEAPVRALVRNVLERHGYKVMEADSGRAALETWSRYREAALVLTDMVMPGGMTGRELGQQLHSFNPVLPVIYTSGYSADVVGKDFELREGENFLQKPYTPRKLLLAVRQALDKAT